MGRSIESVSMGDKEVSARWLKASKALKKEDQIYGQKLAEMAKKHSSESFYAPGAANIIANSRISNNLLMDSRLLQNNLIILPLNNRYVIFRKHIFGIHPKGSFYLPKSHLPHLISYPEHMTVGQIIDSMA